jgi:hypothetical protein
MGIFRRTIVVRGRGRRSYGRWKSSIAAGNKGKRFSTEDTEDTESTESTEFTEKRREEQSREE